MKQPKLENLTVDDLVDLFAEIGVEQDRAIFREKIAEFNKLYSDMDAVDDELKRRGPGARRALLRLYNHPNIQVRVKAAIRTLAVARDPATHLLQTIANSNRFPQAANAGMILDGLSDGSFVPN